MTLSTIVEAVAKSRKGSWHMAKTIASSVGFTNAWLAKQGLVSLKHLWNELAPQF